jgi:hypothetical protein
MAGRLIGDAYIVIYPQTDQFPALLKADVEKWAKSVRPQVPVDPTLDKAAAAKVDAQLSALGKDVEVDAVLSPESEAVIRGSLDALTDRLPVTAYLSPESLAALEAQLEAASHEQLKIDAALNPADIISMQETVDALARKDLIFRSVFDPADIASMKGTLAEFQHEKFMMDAVFDPAQLAVMKASMDAYLHENPVYADVLPLIKSAMDPAQLAAIDQAVSRMPPVDIPVAADPAQVDELKTGIEDALERKPVEIPVKIDTAPATAELADVAAKAAVLQTALGSLRANIKGEPDALLVLKALETQAARISFLLSKAPDDSSLARYAAQLTRMQASAESIATGLKKDFTIPDAAVQSVTNVEAAVENAAAKMAEFKTAEGDAAQAGEKIAQALEAAGSGTGLAPAQAKLAQMAASVIRLQTNLASLRANVDDTGAEARIAALQVQANALAKTLAGAGDSADFDALGAKLLAISAGFEKVKQATADADGELSNSVGLWKSLGLQGPGSLIHITDILNGTIPPIKLFGGAVGAIYAQLNDGASMNSFANHMTNVASSAHLSMEAVIEFSAIWGPALIALATFSAAAVPTVESIAKQLENMHTASVAVGQSFSSLGKAGESVTEAVKPTILEAFGEAEYALQNHTSSLNKAMVMLGQGIDQFAAKAATAFDSKAAGTFMQDGAKDALALMQSFEDLGSVLGTLMKAVPGYAEILLGFGNDMLGAAAKVAPAIEGILAQFLRLHGAILYGGLFGTAAATLFTGLISGATSVVEVIGSMAAKFLGTENVITTGSGKILLALDSIGPGAALGIGLVVGALAAVILYLKSSKDAAQSFSATIQQTVSNASLGGLAQALKTGIQQTTSQYVAATNQLAAANKNVGQSTLTVEDPVIGLLSKLPLVGQTFSNMIPAVAKAGQAQSQYKAGLVQLTGEQTNMNANLQQLAGTFHTTIPGALAIASGAQITSNQLTSSGASNWNTIKAEAEGYVTEIKIMTGGVGTLNGALEALNITNSSQYADVQKVTGAWNTFLGIVTGGDSAFTTFEQGQATLASSLKAGSSAGVTLTTTAGKLQDKITLVGTAMNGTSQSALAARQAFDSQIQAAGTLYGNLQTMATVSGNSATAQEAMAKAGKDVVAQLLPMAQGSKTATAEVYALAQIAGYGGPDSFQAMTKWLGNTKNAESDLSNETTILTESTANLSQAAKTLSAALSNEITQAEAAAIAKTDGLQQATLNLAQAVDKSQGAASSAVTTYSGSFYESLIHAGVGASTATQQVDAFLNQLGASSTTIAGVNKYLATLPSSFGAAGTAAKALATDTEANESAFDKLNSTTGMTAKDTAALWNALKAQDLDMVSGKAASAQTAFVSFAETGLNKTASQAEALWKTAAAQNLTMLAGKAGTTESSFVSLAKSGLGLTNTQATQLWATLREQYLDTLVQKGDSAEGAFVKLAKSGLDLTTSSATQLWNTMKQQYLDTLATKAGETESAFVAVAKQFNVTQQAAETLYTSLRQIAAGSPYTAEVKVTEQVVGAVATNGTTQNILGEVTTKSAAGGIPFPVHAASGYTVPGGIHGQDSQLAVLAPGELVIPASHAASFRDQARKASIPGFAAGGQLPAVGASVPGPVNAALKQALAVTQTPLSWLPALQILAQKSSAADPSYTSPLTVSGQRPAGLFQLLPSVFRKYAQAGFSSDQASALDSAVAAVRYIKQTWGSPAAITGIGTPGTFRGYSAGGMVPEPVFGIGASGRGYSFAENGPEYVGPLSGNGSASAGMPGLNQYQGNTLIQQFGQMIKLMQQQPYAYAQALTQANGQGVRRGYFAVSG